MIEKVRKSRIASLFMVLMLLASMSGAFTADSMAQSVALKNFQAVQSAAQEEADNPEVTDPEVTDPEVTDPAEGDAPVVDEPVVTDPEVTDPVVPDPAAGDAPQVGDPATGDAPAVDEALTSPEDDGSEDENVNQSGEEEAPLPAEVDTPADVDAPAQSRQMAPAQEVNYCDITQKPTTTTLADWFAQSPVPCLEVVNNQPGVCGVVDFSLNNRLVGIPGAVTHRLFWSVGPYSLNNRVETFPSTFPEDENDGSVEVRIALVTNERDYITAVGGDAFNVYYSIHGGAPITIDTDCLPNIPTPEENPNYYCETEPTVGGGVANWLRLAVEGGYTTDCLNVGAPVQACGTLDIPYENLTPYSSALYWNIGTEPDGNAGQPLPITAGTFTEDQNGGEVVVTVWIGHPESDYYPYIGEADQAYTYAAGGVEFTIDTDCVDPIGDPGLPTPIEPAVCQMSFAGYTVMTSSGVTVREKIGGDEQGEVNADGWGGQVGADGWAGTMRLYGATRHDLTDVTMTWTVVGGG